jgi:hypothetical protein|tara:strand:+ start:964 stop:1278 length:315 start_codon:yes stop_codon:yes gene_type:complete
MIDITTVQTLKEGGFQINGNMCIGPFPADPNAPIVNEGHASIKKWIDAGNTPTPYSAPVKTWEENRQAEYPKIEELVVALYDTDDKAALDKRRSDVKAKYPKPE